MRSARVCVYCNQVFMTPCFSTTIKLRIKRAYQHSASVVVVIVVLHRTIRAAHIERLASSEITRCESARPRHFIYYMHTVHGTAEQVY